MLKTIKKIKQYYNISIFKVANKKKNTKNKDVWKKYLIPSNKKNEDVSSNIDNILYHADNR